MKICKRCGLKKPDSCFGKRLLKDFCDECRYHFTWVRGLKRKNGWDRKREAKAAAKKHARLLLGTAVKRKTSKQRMAIKRMAKYLEPRKPFQLTVERLLELRFTPKCSICKKDLVYKGPTANAVYDRLYSEGCWSDDNTIVVCHDCAFNAGELSRLGLSASCLYADI